jgi:hypothetical protein
MTGSDPHMGKHTMRDAQGNPVLDAAGPHATAASQSDPSVGAAARPRESYWYRPSMPLSTPPAQPDRVESVSRATTAEVELRARHAKPTPAPVSSEESASATRIRRPTLLRATAIVAGIVALLTLGTGLTFGLLSGTKSGTLNSFTAGKVKITSSSPGQSCDVTNALPGQSSTSRSLSPCTFTGTYTGASSAFIAADVLVVGGTSTASEGALWTSLATGLQLTLKTSGGTHTFTVPTSTVSCGSVAAEFGTVAQHGVTCGQTTDDLVTTSAVTSGSFTLNLTWTLPATSPSSAQNTVAQIYVVFHAVQSKDNALPGTCTTEGAVCASTSSFHWS